MARLPAQREDSQDPLAGDQGNVGGVLHPERPDELERRSSDVGGNVQDDLEISGADCLEHRRDHLGSDGRDRFGEWEWFSGGIVDDDGAQCLRLRLPTEDTARHFQSEGDGLGDPVE